MRPPAPRYSDDGQWWWTGDQWVSAIQSLGELPPGNRNLGDGTGVKATKIALGLLALVVVATLFWLYDSQTQQNLQDETDRIKCHEFGLCY